MAEPHGSSRFASVLREEFLPYLQLRRDPDQLSEILSRLAGAVGADGGVLWRTEAVLGEGEEAERLISVATTGCVNPDWPAAHADESAAASVCRMNGSVVFDPNRGPYRPDVSGFRLAQVGAVPVRGPKGRAGCVELWWKAGGPEPASADDVLPAVEDVLSEAMPALLEHEAERRNYLNAIARLMMLYDIGKVFHSTLELNELAPLILSRVQNILEAESAALWLLDPVKKNLYCPAAGGPKSEKVEALRVWASDPGLGSSASQGEAVLLHDVDDPAWTERWGAPIRSLVAAPLTHGGRFLGAIEAIRGADSPYFTEEDLRLLIDVGKQAAVSLRNAQRHQAEKRVKELNALMEISKEITATLNLDRVLTTAVNRITSVIPADRCSVSIQRKGRWEVSAISGEMKVDRKNPTVQALEGIHVWLAGAGADISIVETEEGIEAEREEVRQKFAAYFEQSGMRALTGLLLRDEEGPVGVLVLESKAPESLTPSHNDLARIFANQVTVAVRNALLYQQVPLVGVLRPLAEKKAKFAALPAVRRSVMIAGAVAVLLFLVFFPWWSKPSGEARVLPAEVRPVSAEVEGVVGRVHVREGERVEAGQLIAELQAHEHQVALEQSQAQRDILYRRVLQLEAAGDLGAARLERARLDQVAAELDLHRSRLVQTQIRSPLAGVVITPRLEERVGQLLRRGDVLCQVVALDRAWAEISVPELEVGEVGAGQEAWLKLNTFPARKFTGHVVRVSPQGRQQGEDRVFDVIVEVPNSDGALRAGMTGRGKVLARRASIGYLMLRAPARWIWLKLWNWLP